MNACLARNAKGGRVGGSVPATLSLTLGAPATFGAFVPAWRGTTRPRHGHGHLDAGDATLSVSDPGADERTFACLPAQVAFSKSAWTAPTSNESVTIAFKQ